MTTPSSRFFDELARLMSNAAGAAQGVRREIDTLVQAQVERVLDNMEIVKREEFEAVKDMVARAREENDLLRERIERLEARLAPTSSTDPDAPVEDRPNAHLDACSESPASAGSSQERDSRS